MTQRLVGFLGVVLCLLAAPLAAQSLGPAVVPDGAVERAAPAPAPHVAEAMITPAATLRSAAVAAPEQIAALANWNRQGMLPTRNGFARPLPQVIEARLDGLPAAGTEVAADGRSVSGHSLAGEPLWATQVRVEGAWRLRAHLEDVDLPAGARLQVHGIGEEPRVFGLEMRGPDGDLWTPSVAGEVLYLEVALPAGTAPLPSTAFRMREVMEFVALDDDDNPQSELDLALKSHETCLVDASCVTPTTIASIASSAGRSR